MLLTGTLRRLFPTPPSLAVLGGLSHSSRSKLRLSVSHAPLTSHHFRQWRHAGKWVNASLFKEFQAHPFSPVQVFSSRWGRSLHQYIMKWRSLCRCLYADRHCFLLRVGWTAAVSSTLMGYVFALPCAGFSTLRGSACIILYTFDPSWWHAHPTLTHAGPPISYYGSFRPVLLGKPVLVKTIWWCIHDVLPSSFSLTLNLKIKQLFLDRCKGNYKIYIKDQMLNKLKYISWAQTRVKCVLMRNLIVLAIAKYRRVDFSESGVAYNLCSRFQTLCHRYPKFASSLYVWGRLPNCRYTWVIL